MGNKPTSINDLYKCNHKVVDAPKVEIGSSCWIKTPRHIKPYHLSEEECKDRCGNDHSCIGTFTNNIFTQFRKEENAFGRSSPYWSNDKTKLDCTNFMIGGYGHPVLFV